VAGKLVHHVLLVLSVDRPCHHRTVQAKAQNVANILQEQRHLSTKGGGSMGLQMPPINEGGDKWAILFWESSNDSSSQTEKPGSC
jgi:hypothetical protein